MDIVVFVCEFGVMLCDGLFFCLFLLDCRKCESRKDRSEINN